MTTKAITAVAKVIRAEEGEGDWLKVIAKGFHDAGFMDITPGDVQAWYNGDGPGNDKKVAAAVDKLLGKKTAEHYDSLSRLDSAVAFKLGIPGAKKVIGGVDVSKSYD